MHQLHNLYFLAPREKTARTSRKFPYNHLAAPQDPPGYMPLGLFILWTKNLISCPILFSQKPVLQDDRKL